MTRNLYIDTRGTTTRVKGVQKINFVKSSDTDLPQAEDLQQQTFSDPLDGKDKEQSKFVAVDISQKFPDSDLQNCTDKEHSQSESDSERLDKSASGNLNKPNMEHQFTQGGSLHSVPGQGTAADSYSDFQQVMNDSGVSLSGEVSSPAANQFHYHGSYQKYGDGHDVSQQVEDYLKQWAQFYETQHGHDPKIRYDYKAFQDTENPDDLEAKNKQGAGSNLPAPTPPSQVKKKISIVNPNFNFVKASSEFKSIDISQRVVEKEKHAMVPTVLAGKNRMGLGASSRKGGENQSAPMINFIKSGKGVAFLETKFNNLCKEIKNRNAPNRNAIEVLHQCVNKCKMQINDVFHTNDRLPDGRVKYTCNLEINSVFVSTGGAPSKKVAKMEAYNKAMSLLSNPPVAIQQKSEEELYLIQKIEIGPAMPEKPAAQPPANKQKFQQNWQQNKQTSQKTNEVQQPNENDKAKEAYAKPKMVFHKAGEPVKKEEPPAPTAHPLSDKPLEFKKPEAPSQSGTASLTTEKNVWSKPLTGPSQGGARPHSNSSQGRDERFNRGGGQFNRGGGRDDRFSRGGGQFGNRGGRGGMPYHRQSEQFEQGGYDRHGYDMPYYKQEQRGYGPNFDEYDAHNYGRYDYPDDDYDDCGYDRHDDYGYDQPDRPYDHRADFERKEFYPEGHGGGHKREGDRFSLPSVVKKVKKGGNVVLDDISDFIIMDYSGISSNVNATSILHNSANFNRVVLKYQFEQISGFGCRCKLLISDEVVASCFGSNKEDAKKAAGEEALNSLQEKCYTIRVKQDVDNDEAEGLTKDEFLSEVKRGGNVIPDNNIGNMLLKKMGWVGGGVGKHGTGIAEPIKADQVIGREGLGLTASKGIDKSFHGKVEKMLVDYTRSNEQNDLHFSPEFTKEERAMIHKSAQKYGLKSHSKGKDPDRFLIISRKRSAPQLLDHVMNSGGTTSKYEVIPPKSQQDDDEYFARDRQPVWNAVSYGHDKQ